MKLEPASSGYKTVCLPLLGIKKDAKLKKKLKHYLGIGVYQRSHDFRDVFQVNFDSKHSLISSAESIRHASRSLVE